MRSTAPPSRAKRSGSADRVGLALALIAGLGLGAAFLPAPLGFLAWFAFVPFLVALDRLAVARAPLRRVLVLGYVFGFAFYLCGTHWIALLSDVARHAGANRQAEQALVVLRRRFPGTGDAALAAFALGRLEFDEFHAYARAAVWFRTYLNERPSGSMTREALGRLIEACYRARDVEGARSAAARYLRDYPSGPHAELASRVAASP